MMNLAEYRRTAARLADYLPWMALVGQGVVLNKDGSFQRSAKFRGPDLDSAVAAELVGAASAPAGRSSSRRSGPRPAPIRTMSFPTRPPRWSMPSARPISRRKAVTSSRTTI